MQELLAVIYVAVHLISAHDSSCQLLAAGSAAFWPEAGGTAYQNMQASSEEQLINQLTAMFWMSFSALPFFKLHFASRPN
jgi:hypothetical protein